MVNNYIGIGTLTANFENIPNTNRKGSTLQITIANKTYLIPVTIDNNTILPKKIRLDKRVYIEGSVRSYPEKDGDVSHNRLHVHAKTITYANATDKDTSFVHIQGTVHSKPYSCTKGDKPLTQTLCVVPTLNRMYYIPVIAWSKSSKFLADCHVGQEVDVVGTFVSRNFKKYIGDTCYNRTTYEIVASRVIHLGGE